MLTFIPAYFFFFFSFFLFLFFFFFFFILLFSTGENFFIKVCEPYTITLLTSFTFIKLSKVTMTVTSWMKSSFLRFIVNGIAITYFAMFSNESFCTVAFERVVSVVSHTSTTVLAWRRQTCGLKYKQKISRSSRVNKTCIFLLTKELTFLMIQCKGNKCDRNRRFGTSCAIIKVTQLMIKRRFVNRLS